MTQTESASDLFWDVFTGGGANQIDCVCGREHFSRQPSHWDDETELEDLLNRECAMPDRVIGTDDDSVGYASVTGLVLCYGCPCRSAAKYEHFIVSEQSRVASYYKRLVAQKRNELNALEDSLQEPS